MVCKMTKTLRNKNKDGTATHEMQALNSTRHINSFLCQATTFNRKTFITGWNTNTTVPYFWTSMVILDPCSCQEVFGSHRRLNIFLHFSHYSNKQTYLFLVPNQSEFVFQQFLISAQHLYRQVFLQSSVSCHQDMHIGALSTMIIIYAPTM